MALPPPPQEDVMGLFEYILGLVGHRGLSLKVYQGHDNGTEWLAHLVHGNAGRGDTCCLALLDTPSLP